MNAFLTKHYYAGYNLPKSVIDFAQSVHDEYQAEVEELMREKSLVQGTKFGETAGPKIDGLVASISTFNNFIGKPGDYDELGY